MAEKSYHEQERNKCTLELRELQNELPKFLRDYFRGIENSTAPRTQIGYAIDLRTFFEFVKDNNSTYRDVDMHDIGIDILSQLNAQDIEEYLDYLKYYVKNGHEYTNDERAIKRKLSALRSMYNYFHKKRIIDENPVLQVDMPKLHKKQIIRLDNDEVDDLLNVVESGDRLTKKQAECHDKLKVRDMAILTLLLGTGMRVSECVGINLEDVDYINDRIKIVRKGGYESFVYYGEEVRQALLDYMEERDEIDALEGHKNALFLSSQRRRITVRSVELLVKKYASTVTGKHITPHKLRSTYGTNLYKETGDIYLVADVLGHSDVNTTRKHYAELEEDRKKSVKDAVVIRHK
ncbi:integrase family protein [Firmicutes bacterium CAG:882]|mgnify:FL=1|nr:integrase family protein [Firmicutes bacterium CAG:882]